jgi:hypothetical protein
MTKPNTPGETIQIRFKPATLRLLTQLSAKTGLPRNTLIRYAIARLAEREGITMPTRVAAKRTAAGR